MLFKLCSPYTQRDNDEQLHALTIKSIFIWKTEFVLEEAPSDQNIVFIS